MKFEQALAILEEGVPVYRDGWCTKDLFVFKQVPAEISVDIVPNMQSLPRLVKDVFIFRSTLTRDIRFTNIYYGNQLALVDSKNNISGWSPSTPDALAEDWEVYK
jgi:hypothetical protein